ncbi:hypothetical protein B0H16DRAFT_1483477 [Mycena metata]|uniref:Uncharacterized protein n=1 Tax=Mycena metata TaxID=1033252 RepID=A0AAD7GM75_9AGAR|nr:hypothetical protein B0H16DRAFT_1483477 [Mycena metata]
MSRKQKCTPEEILDRRAQAAWEYRRRHREAINEKARIRMHKFVASQLFFLSLNRYERQTTGRTQRRRAELKQAPSAVQGEHAAKARQYRRRYIERNAPVARSVVSPKKKKMVSAEIVRVKPKSTETHPLTAAITRTPPTQLMMSSEYRLASPPQRRAGSSPIPPSPPTPTPIRKTAAPPGPKRVLPTPVAPKGPWWESLKATPPRDASWMAAVNRLPSDPPTPTPRKRDVKRAALPATPQLTEIAARDSDSESDSGGASDNGWDGDAED